MYDPYSRSHLLKGTLRGNTRVFQNRACLFKNRASISFLGFCAWGLDQTSSPGCGAWRGDVKFFVRDALLETKRAIVRPNPLSECGHKSRASTLVPKHDMGTHPNTSQDV